MKRTFLATLAFGAAAVVTPATASTESHMGYLVTLRVPVICKVNYDGQGFAELPQGYQLGDLREYCNAPDGYTVTVNYQPGTMRGAVVALGNDRVVLDGSGTGTVSRAPGPRMRHRAIVAIPGPDGFDTDRLNFNINVA